MASSIWDMAQRSSPGKYPVYSVSSQVGLSAEAERSPEMLGPSRSQMQLLHVHQQYWWASAAAGHLPWEGQCGDKCCMPSVGVWAALYPWSQRWPSEERWCLEQEAVRLGGRAWRALSKLSLNRYGSLWLGTVLLCPESNAVSHGLSPELQAPCAGRGCGAPCR